MLVDAMSPLGAYLDYSLAPPSRLDYIKNNAPKELDALKLIKMFKKDIFFDGIAEIINDALVYYIKSSNSEGEELYYFSAGNKMFHGDRIWTSYHNFYPCLSQIKPSAIVETPCWFIGSRHNYTHQLVDFAPSLLYQTKLMGSLQIPSIINVFGNNNSILDSLSEVPLFRLGLARPKLYLESLGTPIVFGGWRIRCIQFKQLYLARHLSVFMIFSLLYEAFGIISETNLDNRDFRNRSLLYLARSDARVLNQDDICLILTSRLGATVLRDTHNLTYSSKKRIISTFGQIILPPGSDNINGLCFSKQSASLFQMTPVPVANLLDSPFSSYAGLRYLLPYLHRLVFVPGTGIPVGKSFNSGYWNTCDLEELLRAS
jgi:hypothetical protein